jgi:hypothetical protein
MKPDVLEQIKVIEAERIKIMQEQQQKNVGQLMLNEEGKPPRPLTNDDIVKLMNMQIEEIKALSAKNTILEKMVANLQKHISELKSQVNKEDNGVINISPTVGPSLQTSSSSPAISDSPTSFVSTLLSRIQELEKEIDILRNNKTFVQQPSVQQPSVQQPSVQQPSVQQPLIQQNTSSKTTPIILKSKSVPEVPINI